MDAAAAEDVPGTGGLKRKPVARSRCLALAPTGRCWAAATTEGLMMFSLDDDMVSSKLSYPGFCNDIERLQF